MAYAIKGSYYGMTSPLFHGTKRVKVTKVAHRHSLSTQRTVWYRWVHEDGSMSTRPAKMLESEFKACTTAAPITIREDHNHA
jgi:hypothetical protein